MVRLSCCMLPMYVHVPVRRFTLDFIFVLYENGCGSRILQTIRSVSLHVVDTTAHVGFMLPCRGAHVYVRP